MWQKAVPVCDMTHSCAWHDSFPCVLWRALLCYSFMCVPWLIHVYYDSFMCVPWLIHVCTMTHLCVYHDSFMCVPWLIYVCTMNHSCVYHDSFMCVPWRIPMWLVHVTHRLWRTMCACNGGASVWRDSFSCLPCLIPMCIAWLMVLGCIFIWNVFHVGMHHRTHRRRRSDLK